MNKTWIIGSRGSDLALWQARFLEEKLRALGATCTIRIIKTQGDAIQDLPFDKLEGKGFFTKEIEEALLAGEIDIAVHSHKDLETSDVPGLVIAGVSYREDPSELLLVRKESVDHSMSLALKKGAVLGTSSARRKNQTMLFRDDLHIKDLRGNVPTRVQKLRDGDYDAILLARAGVDRLKLDLADLHVEVLDVRKFIPPPAQGVLAFQVRENDAEARELIGQLNNPEIARIIGLEREVLRLLQGGCQLPLGVICRKEEDRYAVWASLASQHCHTPRRYFTQLTDSELTGARILEGLVKPVPAKVLITRELAPDSVFVKLLESAGVEITCRSYISFAEVGFRDVPSTSWIFFSSKNAVRFFLGKAGNPHGAKIGAIGAATAAAIRKAGFDVAFTGEGNDTMKIGKGFAERVGHGTVLFPVSDISLRNVQQCFPEEQVKDLVTYRTLARNTTPLPDADALVFTSPSNVKAYLKQHQVHPDQKVIAMGKTTAGVLEDAGVSGVILPWGPEEVALADAVLS
ncbi:MAG: hydroxymethylbilane synthase [Flavobacteriales bacterium]|nr:hydroxymethylbilane synthase [Flavobacteriales bacterium]